MLGRHGSRHGGQVITLCPQWENWDRAGPRAWFSFFFFTQFWTPAQRVVLPPLMVALLALVKLFGNAPEDAPSQVSFHGDSKSSQTANSCHPKADKAVADSMGIGPKLSLFLCRLLCLVSASYREGVGTVSCPGVQVGRECYILLSQLDQSWNSSSEPPLTLHHLPAPHFHPSVVILSVRQPD